MKELFDLPHRGHLVGSPLFGSACFEYTQKFVLKTTRRMFLVPGHPPPRGLDFWVNYTAERRLPGQSVFRP